jgi:DeoR/GlpR family transcriptional regulator of sugar metabolism
MSKKVELRADRIMKALLRAGEISVQELSEEVGISAPSIRRDLARLEERGLVLRTHGGVTLVGDQGEAGAMQTSVTLDGLTRRDICGFEGFTECDDLLRF